jgi:hypothetical protein
VTKVLYIEHDDTNLYMLKMRLEQCGDFEVLAAFCGVARWHAAFAARRDAAADTAETSRASRKPGERYRGT